MLIFVFACVCVRNELCRLVTYNLLKNIFFVGYLSLHYNCKLSIQTIKKFEIKHMWQAIMSSAPRKYLFYFELFRV